MMRKWILKLMVACFLVIGLNTSAETLTLPSSIKSIEEEAFFGDKSLNVVVLPEGIETIAEKAFASSSLAAINLPASLTNIADDAFADTPFSEMNLKTDLCPIRTTALTTNGIEFTPIGDGSYLVNGTSEKGANYNLYYSRICLPEGFEAEKTYHLEYEDTSGTNELRICMCYYNEEGSEELLFVNTYQSVDFTVPAEAIGLLIRIRVMKADIQINNAVVNPIITEIADTGGLEEPLFDSTNLCPERTTALTTNGIEFTPFGDGRYRVNGISEKGANYNLYYNKTALPQGFETGKTYRLEYEDTSFTEKLHVCIHWFDEYGLVETLLLDTFYSANFTIPKTAVGLLIRLRVVSANVTFNNVIVKPIITTVEQLGYPQPMITIIDDDGCFRYYRDLLPLCVEKGVSISSAVVPLQIEAREKGESKFWMSWAEIAECQSNGIEILSHTYDHAATTVVESRSIEEIRDTYQLAKDILLEHGIDTSILVYSGNSGSLVKCRLAAKEVYDFGIRAGGNVDNQYGQMDPYCIWRYKIPDYCGFEPENLKELIDLLSQKGTGWMVWMIHTSNSKWCDAYVQALSECIDYAKELGIPIVTANEGASYYSWK